VKAHSGSAVVCIGAAHVDRIARCQDEFVRGSSNPVSVAEAAGGVARNVAANLTRLGREVALVSALGHDDEGEALMAALAREGIDVSAVQRCAEFPTATYTAILEPAGELVAGLSEAAIYEALGPALLADLAARFAEWPGWVVDANLPGESLSALNPAGRLFACAVSPAKARRLSPCLGRIEGLFANRAEVAALSGRAVGSPEDALAAGQALRQSGLGSAFVTLGSDGVAVAAPGVSAIWPALPSAVRDVNGAGDAFAAGVIDGLLGGAALADAVGRGLAMASLAAECDGPVPSLDLGALAARAAGAEVRA
jgi:sugar/nucleoside kinase (ribokinase family)